MATSKKGIEPDGLSRSKGAQPDDFAKHGAVDDDDVEGHSMLLNPTLGRDVHKARSADVERAAKAKAHESDAKRIFRR